MLVYIAGSGAMGCRFGYQLSKTNHEVILLDIAVSDVLAVQLLHFTEAVRKRCSKAPETAGIQTRIW